MRRSAAALLTRRSPQYLVAPSRAAHAVLSFRSAHLPGDFEHEYGQVGSPEECALCGAAVYSECEDLGADPALERRWRHVEHLAVVCPLVTPVGRPDVRCVDVLREDLLAAARDHAWALRAVRAAFPAGDIDPAGAVACSVPFLLDPVAAVRGGGPVPQRVGVECVNLVAAFLVGVSARVCAGPAELLAGDALLGLGLPGECGVACLTGWARSPAQDAVAAGCDLLDGVCVCDLSAPRGAEADALAGMA